MRELDEAVARAHAAMSASPARSISKSRPTCCAPHVPPALVLEDWLQAEAAARDRRPTPAGVAAAVEAIWSRAAPAGRSPGAARATPAPRWCACSTPPARSISTPRRAAAWCRPSTVVRRRDARGGDDRGRYRRCSIGRKLDYQLGYGSPAVFPTPASSASPTTPASCIDNRRGEPELAGDAARSRSTAIVEAAGNREPACDKAWADGLARTQHEQALGAGARAPASAATTARCIRAAIFDAIARGRRARLHRHRRRRRPAELRPRRHLGAHLHGRRRVRLPRRRRAVRDRRRARRARPAGDLDQRRRRLRHQRDGDRHRGAPRRQVRCSSSPTTRPGTSSATTRR